MVCKVLVEFRKSVWDKIYNKWNIKVVMESLVGDIEWGIDYCAKDFGLKELDALHVVKFCGPHSSSP